jgi:predicted aspartyl protease
MTRITCAAFAYAVTVIIALQFGASANAAIQKPSLANRVVARFTLQPTGTRLNVTINGQGPFSFGFDSGASGEAWVSRALVSRLKLPAIDTMRVSDGSGVNSRTVETVRIDSLAIGEAVFERLRAPVLGEGPQQDDGAEAYGTIGFELFRDYLLTLDYLQNELRVTTGELAPADARTILTYVLESGTPHVDLDLAGRRLRASIDSGSGGGLTVPRSLADGLPLRMPVRLTGKVASSLGVFDLFQGELAGDLQIGAFVFPQPVVFFSDLVTVPTLGRSILRTFTVTFDQRNHRILLARP